MDRGTRRLQKARIRACLRQIFAEEIRDDEQRCFAYNRRPDSQDEINALWRRIHRNEGKRFRALYYFPYRKYRCDCEWCLDSRRYRTNREAERMEQDRRGWWKFGSGEGEEGEEAAN